jgi:hypothetical protein
MADELPGSSSSEAGQQVRTLPVLGPGETTDSAKSRDCLEREKLRLEIVALKRSAWRQPSVILPIAAALVTLGLSQYLGVFDVERKRVELETQKAEMQRSELNRDLKTLQAQKTQLEQDKGELDERKKGLGLELTNLQVTVKKLKSEASYAKTVLGRPVLTFKALAMTVARQGSFSVLNKGRGLAVLKQFRWYADGRPVPDGPNDDPYGPLLTALGMRGPWIRWYTYESVKPDAESPLLLIEPTLYTDENAITFEQNLDRVGVELCYCSNFGDCYWATYGRPEIKKRTCE